MNELQSFFHLINKIKNDENFRKRNLSALIQNIPYIGNFIETNTIGYNNDVNLESRLKEIENISKEALSKEDIDDIINIIEQNSLTINSFMMEYKNEISNSNKNIDIKFIPIKIALSFVDKDLHIAKKIAKQLIENNITVVTNKEKLSISNENIILDYNMPISVESLILIYTNNYEKNSRSAFNHTTFFRSAQRRSLPIITFAFEHFEANDLNIHNSFNQIFDYQDMDHIISTFFFDEFKKVRKIEYADIKRYSDVENILSLYNNNFKKITSFQKDKVGFELYQQDHLTGNNTYCIYLYDNINTKKTIEYIKLIHKDKNIFNDFFILLNRPKNIKDPQKRKDYIKSIFTDKKIFIYFIDDFIWDRLTKRYFDNFKKRQLPLTNFVKPFLQYKDKQFDSFNFIDSWLHRENDPILVITGSGGIGKTTLVSKITNRINNNDDRTTAIFIDAVKISSIIKQYYSSEKSIDLYSFYEASHNGSDNKINSELFRINIDNGHFVIVIDGLDEIISRLGESFNINDFFESIKTFTKKIGNGKVILTSRNYFWDISNDDLYGIELLNILPFTEKKAEEFFKNEYANKPRIVERAMKISKSILGKKENTDYLPYVLELVCSMIDETMFNQEFYDPDFNSEILMQNIKTDYVLGKICVREIQRVKQISVDNQLKLFFEIATNRVEKDKLKEVANRLFDKSSLNSKQIEAFKSHPVLHIIENEIIFKYDFFKNHIKNIYLSELFNKESINVNKEHILILTNNVTYNSSFVEDLCSRIPIVNEISIFRALNIINEIKNLQDQSINPITIRKAISSVFIIYIRKLHLTGANDIARNTNLLKHFFETKTNTINDVNIIDLSSNSNNKIIFDFKGLTLINCYFRSYDYFWECSFNEKTKFYDSYFYMLHKTISLNTEAKRMNFIEVKGEDDSFTEIIHESSFKSNNKDEKIITDLHEFFSFFCNNGQVDHKKLVYIKGKYSRKIIKLNIMLKELKKANIIKMYDYAGAENVEINTEYTSEILKFNSNRLTRGVIKKIFKVFKMKYN